MIDINNPPELYWHCGVKLGGQKKTTIVNDFDFENLYKTIVLPWREGRPFTVSGTIVRSSDIVETIKITHTDQSQKAFAANHNARMDASGIADFATDRNKLPLNQGEDLTFLLLFDGYENSVEAPESNLVEQVCQRISRTAIILSRRSRKDKEPFKIVDEYDVQDLLHATLRAYLKHSVQEDPIGKVAGAKSSRADISIEDLGALIEIKYVHGPDDQKRIFDEYSQDLVLYAKWPYLKTLYFLIYNSSDLKDAEAFERMSGKQEIAGTAFETKVILG